MCRFVFCETWIFSDDSFAFFLSPANLTEFYSSKKLFVDDFFYSSRQLPIKSTFFVCDNCRNMQDDFNGPLRKPLIGFIDFCDMFLYENKTFFPLNFHRKYWFKLIETVTFSHLYVMGHVVGCAWFLHSQNLGWEKAIKWFLSIVPQLDFEAAKWTLNGGNFYVFCFVRPTPESDFFDSLQFLVRRVFSVSLSFHCLLMISSK